MTLLSAHGSIQGVIHSLQKEVRRPFFRVRELSTDAMVKCYYPNLLYGEVVEALRERTAVVHVAGDTIFDRASRSVVELRVERIQTVRMLSREEFEQFFGGDQERSHEWTANGSC